MRSLTALLLTFLLSSCSFTAEARVVRPLPFDVEITADGKAVERLSTNAADDPLVRDLVERLGYVPAEVVITMRRRVLAGEEASR